MASAAAMEAEQEQVGAVRLTRGTGPETAAAVEAVEAELAAALDEKEAWLARLHAAREAQREGVATVDQLLGETQALRKAGAEAEATIASLAASNDELRAQLDELAGHQNHRQRIQHTMRIKEENGRLQEERSRLQEELGMTQRLITRLRWELDRTQRRAARGYSCGASECGSTAPSLAPSAVGSTAKAGWDTTATSAAAAAKKVRETSAAAGEKLSESAALITTKEEDSFADAASLERVAQLEAENRLLREKSSPHPTSRT